MLSLGFGGTPPEDEFNLDDLLTLKMIQMLEEHGWEFSYGRDPLLILVEIEEYLIENGDLEP